MKPTNAPKKIKLVNKPRDKKAVDPRDPRDPHDPRDPRGPICPHGE